MIKVSCPICQKALQGEREDFPFFPFCGERCKTIDLGRWLSEEEYGLPTLLKPDASPEESEEQPP